ncbi:methyltransferase domain-containing protein [Hymenobacter oligotrophus]|uniref:Methyltransferase domain-containing protein n=1 Tax=Hymenobacter oligotrophus TaxID=2319843 RepID=A0A3B7RRQ4_9BACT|nr:methyltransferase domain-containing protein [Hymenobacter oligotrophus]AYA36827.1 methyltransferase domain-containing protein [Hymenobacter oligotrophus]
MSSDPNQLFSANAFRRVDETPDAQFYRQPRFVTHIDEGAIAAVTQLYREYFAAGSTLLDLMSSWVSHLPPEVQYGRVVGLGMNEAELRANPRLQAYVVQDLNQQPQLPFADAEFGGGAICVSVDYLTQPVAVMQELGRVLQPGAPLVITFSNRCFPTKAIAAWHQLSDQGHLQLVGQYLQAAGNWHGIELLDRSPRPRGFSDPLFAVVGQAGAAQRP